MSFDSLLNRTISVVPMDAHTTDRYNNDVTGPGTPITGVRARRHQLTATEDNVDRDQQSQTFRYFLPAGTPISGRDRIVDGDDTLEVLGPPEIVARNQPDHHIELRAQLIEG